MVCLTQTWTTSYSEQKEYIRNLLDELEEIDLGSQAIVVYQNTEPTDVELLAAWQDQADTDQNPIVGSTFYWYNPDDDVIENVFMPIDDISVGLSSGQVWPYYVKDKSLDWVFLDELYAQSDTALASFIIDNIDQTYQHLFFTAVLRGVGAVTGTTLGIRLNNQAAHATGVENILLTGAAASSVANLTVGAITSLATFIPGDSTGQPSSANIGFGFLFNYSVPFASRFANQFLYYRGVGYIGALAFTAANKMQSLMAGVAVGSTVMPVTRLDFRGPAATWKRGSRVALYGLK